MTLTDIYQKYVEYARVKFEADREPTKWFQMPQFGKVKLPEMEISQRCINETCPEADAAIITIGRQAGEGMDRDVKTEFNLTDIERDMIFRVSDAFRLAGKPVIVILNSGSVVDQAGAVDSHKCRRSRPLRVERPHANHCLGQPSGS